MAFLDKLYGIFGADEQPSPGANGLMVDPQAQVKRDTLLATAAQLLAGSGYSPVRQSTSEILGRALLAGQQARAAAQNRITQQQQAQTEQQLRQAQIDQIKNPTTADITEFKYAQQNGYTGDFNTFLQQKLSARAEPPASIQEWNLVNQGRKANGQSPLTLDQWLQQRADMSLKPFLTQIQGAPTVVTPTNRNGGIVQTPLSTPGAENQAASDRAAATTGGQKGAERLQTQMDTGLDAADHVAIVKRGLDLLDSVKTGGLDAVKLKATNLFGVTGADEAELSANLGKAVLSQLRSTFGAQFTQQEGERLAQIEAGFGKSTEGNRRLLEQAQKIMERAARRGIRAAERSGDMDTAQEIRDALDFSLSNKPASGSANNSVPSDIGSLLDKYGTKKAP